VTQYQLWFKLYYNYLSYNFNEINLFLIFFIFIDIKVITIVAKDPSKALAGSHPVYEYIYKTIWSEHELDVFFADLGREIKW
jgi:hypothetical protein